MSKKASPEMIELYKTQLAEARGMLTKARTIKEFKFLQSKIEFFNDQINGKKN